MGGRLRGTFKHARAFTRVRGYNAVMETFTAGLIAIFPPIAVGVLFYFVMRAIFRADRHERQVMEQMEAEYAREQAARAKERDNHENNAQPK